MALRDQPYLPLYVDDFISDEKLKRCSAESHGVYILIMLYMHKMDEYGVIRLSHRDKKCDSQIENFAFVLLSLLPFSFDVIERSLDELVDRGVLTIDGDELYQKRMRKAGKLSETRASSGSKGGRLPKNEKQNASKQQSKTQAKQKQNTVIVVVDENNNKNTEETTSFEETTDAREEPKNDIGRVMSFYEEQFGVLPSPTACGLLIEYTKDMTADVVCRAIEIAVDARAFNWKYVQSVLQSWAREKVQSLADVEKAEAKRKAEKQNAQVKKTSGQNAQATCKNEKPSQKELDHMHKFLNKLREDE